MVTEVREEQDENADFPMEVTLLGMITDVSKYPLALLNAFSPMAAVGYPPNVDGIVMAPPVPVYPVMVATPLPTVKVKSPSWAAATVSVATTKNAHDNINKTEIVLSQTTPNLFPELLLP
jgi:hypothetical protein